MNIKPIPSLAIVAVGALVIAGCSSTKNGAGSGIRTPQANARNLARETLAQVVDYEEAVNHLNKVYEDYAKLSLKDLQSSVESQTTLAVRKQRDQLARESAEAALSRGVRPSDFREFVLSYQEAGKQEESRLMSAYLAVVERDKAHQAKLDALQKSLKATRDKLDKLQADASFKDHIEEFRAYYKMARDAYDQAKKNSTK